LRITVPDQIVNDARAAFQSIVYSLESAVVGLKASELDEKNPNARARAILLDEMAAQVDRLKLLLT